MCAPGRLFFCPWDMLMCPREVLVCPGNILGLSRKVLDSFGVTRNLRSCLGPAESRLCAPGSCWTALSVLFSALGRFLVVPTRCSCSTGKGMSDPEAGAGCPQGGACLPWENACTPKKILCSSRTLRDLPREVSLTRGRIGFLHRGASSMEGIPWFLKDLLG